MQRFDSVLQVFFYISTKSQSLYKAKGFTFRALGLGIQVHGLRFRLVDREFQGECRTVARKSFLRGFAFVQGLDILKLTKTPLIYTVVFRITVWNQ